MSGKEDQILNIISHHNFYGKNVLQTEISTRKITADCIVSVVKLFTHQRNWMKTASVLNTQAGNWKRLLKRIIFSGCQNTRIF